MTSYYALLKEKEEELLKKKQLNPCIEAPTKQLNRRICILEDAVLQLQTQLEILRSIGTVSMVDHLITLDSMVKEHTIRIERVENTQRALKEIYNLLSNLASGA